MARVMLIGAGGVAGVAAAKMAQNPDVFGELLIASRTKSRCDAIKADIEKRGFSKGGLKTAITTAQLDAMDVAATTAMIREYKPDLVMNIALPYQDLAIMDACLAARGPVPQWYLAMEGERIIGGMGVIENDFHDRKDLAPNVCAVYTEPDRRGQGVAGALLDFVCKDMKARGIGTLYLVTDHTGFYERYGWEFLCMAQGDGEEKMSRMYAHYGKLTP